MDVNVNLNVNFGGTVKVEMKDLVKAMEIYKGSLSTPAPVNDLKTPIENESSSQDTTEKEVVQDTTELNETELVKNDYPTVNADTYRHYAQFNHMETALNKLGEKDSAKRSELIKSFSTDGSEDIGKIPPNAWGKVIAEATDKKDEKKSEPVEETKPVTYSLESVRELARKVQLAKGKDFLAETFKSFGHTRMTEFDPSEYAALYEKLQEAI